MACCNIKVRIAFAVIGVLCGFCAPIFALRFHNWNAGGMCLISGIFAAATLALHISYAKGWLDHAFRPWLRTIMIVGCFGQLIGACAFTAYIALGAVLGQTLGDIYGENYWIATVWGWMTWKWGFQLFWFSREYWREFERNPLLPQKNQSYVYDKDQLL